MPQKIYCHVLWRDVRGGQEVRAHLEVNATEDGKLMGMETEFKVTSFSPGGD